MPKNENGEVFCLNNNEHKMDMVTKMGVMHLQKKPEVEDNNDGAQMNFDVYICMDCQYTELYSRIYDPNDPNNPTQMKVHFGW